MKLIKGAMNIEMNPTASGVLAPNEPDPFEEEQVDESRHQRTFSKPKPKKRTGSRRGKLPEGFFALFEIEQK